MTAIIYIVVIHVNYTYCVLGKFIPLVTVAKIKPILLARREFF